MNAIASFASIVLILLGLLVNPMACASEMKFDGVLPAGVEPGTTVTVTSTSVFDKGVVSVKTSQNGLDRVSIFQMDDNHISDTMAVGSKDGEGGATVILTTYRDSDPYAELKMTLIQNRTAAPNGTEEGLSVKILVYELGGNNISVLVSGKRNGIEASMNCTVPVNKFTSAISGTGKLMEYRESVFNNSSVPVYVVGAGGPVQVTVTNSKAEKVTEFGINDDHGIAYGTWVIPKNQTPGNYSFTFRTVNGTVINGGAVPMPNKIELMDSGTLTPGRPPSKQGTLFSLGGLPVPIVTGLIVLVVGVPIGVLLIRKKKD